MIYYNLKVQPQCKNVLQDHQEESYSRDFYYYKCI